jgi:hypothetical protein
MNDSHDRNITEWIKILLLNSSFLDTLQQLLWSVNVTWRKRVVEVLDFLMGYESYCLIQSQVGAINQPENEIRYVSVVSLTSICM